VRGSPRQAFWRGSLLDCVLGFIYYLFFLSICFNSAMCGWRRASSFAILGLRVGFVRIANVLDLALRLEELSCQFTIFNSNF